ncbi:choice-of-anchor Q domain-containing protein [Phaeodactylibacter sp.]|uniref:choice-of-anchor Q domain-containing protein n=2 Tax=Phaeodactylibacter sp. TaxID=1940289 RepID=UPI0025DAC181|nr:choice-of-anchor Q domain-containing protein [Phaeodactylibacter sp.]MCI5090928.1 hypothetical protein [Phaeodactylibacter sp.]
MKKRLLPNPYTLWPALRKESSPTNAPSTRSRGGLTQLLLLFSLFLTLSVYAKSSIPDFSTATDNLCLNDESTTGVSGGALHFDVVDDHVATCTSTTLADDDVVTCEMTSNDPCADPATTTSNAFTMIEAPTFPPSCSKIQVTTSCTAFDGEYLYGGDYLGGGYWGKSNNSSYEIFFDGTSWVLWDYGSYLFINSTPTLPYPPTTGWLPFPGNACDGQPITDFNIILIPTNPTVTIAADPGNSITTGTSVTFTATPTNGGTSPAYQWKVNGTNVGTDQATYTSTTLADGDVVTCEMTSNDPCADPTTATSAGITMTVIPPCEGVTNRIYVTTTGTGNGSSWANATSDLQAAIDNTCGVTEIWMAAGTYKPADYPTGCTGCSSPRDYAFVLSSGVKVYGGFAGTETALIERTPGNETILSGDIDNDNTLNDGNTHHVVLSINNNDQTLLEGCTVTGGYSPDEGSASITIESEEIYSYDAGGLVAKNSNALFTNNKFVNNLGYHGGGAYVDRGSARFENCQFEDNRSDGGYGIGLYTYDAAVMIDNCHFENNNDDDAYGGGCYLEDGNVDLKNSTFVNNSAYEGGGLYTDDASLTVDSCVFDGNSAYDEGGGYYLAYGRGTVKNCTFVNNTADDGGGLVLDEDSSDLTIENCTFTGNTAEDGIGGAMYLYYPSYKARTVVSNCIFTDNSAGDGGAVYLDSPSYAAVTSFTDCQFINNTGEDGGAIGYESIYEYGLEIERCSFLDNNALYGGAISGAGGDNELLAISNSLFAKNTAQGDEDYPGGGAVYIYEVTEATLTNCTFADNTSVTSAGGGVVNDDSGLTMENCIFWGNTGGQGTLNDQQFFNLSGATANIAHSLFESGLPTGVTNGGNNIFLDPLFTDATNDDYTLDGCSPAINAGDNTDVAATDLVGTTRIQDGTVDMGAYENTLIEGRVVSISIDNISEADRNNTTCTTDDTYTADVTVTYSEKPASGTLSLNGPNVISSEVVDVSVTDATSYTFTGVEMLADGGDIDLTATFSEGCSYSDDEIGTAPECSGEFIPSDITVSGFGCFGPNGTYFFVDYAEGAPFWQSMNDFVIGYIEGKWAIFGIDLISGGLTEWSSNPNGSVDNLPCTTGWTDPQGCALSSGSIALSGGCGSLSGGSSPACAITDISLDNTSGCDGNGTIDDTDDYFTADVTVTFAYAPTDGTLTLKLGNTTLATTEADLTCTTTYTFTGVQLPSDGNDVILTAAFSSDCSFTSATLMTAPEPCSCEPTSDFTACPGELSVNVDPDACSALVSYDAIANGIPEPSYSYVFSGATIANGEGTGSSSAFEVGTTEVVITGTNDCGSATCEFSITVIDNIAPEARCQNRTIQLDAGGSASIAPDEVNNNSTDACGIASLTLSPMHFNCEDLGQNMVTLTATDVNGNSALCMATVTVEIGTALPLPWTANDIGDQGDGSSYTYDPCTGDNPDLGDFSISTGGYNLIPQDSDNLAFASVPLCGNGGIQARIENVQGGYAGLMIRESSAPGAKMIAIYSNLTNLIRREIRTEENGVRSSDLLYASFPYWLRLRRQGDYIRAFYRNTDNGDWQLFHQAYLPMDNCVEMGLAVFTTDPNGDASASFGMVRYRSQVNANLSAPDNLIWETEIPELPKATVSPNPVQDAFTLHFSRPLPAEGTATLLNEFGQRVARQTLRTGETELLWDTGNLPAGMYFLETITDDGYREILKVVRQ